MTGVPYVAVTAGEAGMHSSSLLPAIYASSKRGGRDLDLGAGPLTPRSVTGATYGRWPQWTEGLQHSSVLGFPDPSILRLPGARISGANSSPNVVAHFQGCLLHPSVGATSLTKTDT